MKKVGVTAAQCALGFRIATVMLRIGVKEDSFESFILDVYNRCKDIGVSPENISSFLSDLLEFSKTLPLSKIPHYIKQKTNEKIKLDQDVENLKVEADALRKLRDAALEDKGITTSGLKSYTSLTEELRKYGIPIDDTSRFAKLVNNIRGYGYDAGRVIKEFSDLESLRKSHQFFEQNLQSLQDKATELGRDCATLELRANMHEQFLHKYETLDNMGFGLKELGLKELDSLWNTVNEIARDNNIHPKDAITKFLSDVERQYNNKLGFESKVESLRSEVNNLYKDEARLRTELLLLPLVGPKLVKLTQSGVSEQDIIDIAAVFEKYIAGKDRQSFISDLEVYGSLKSAVQELSKQSERMKIEVTSLQTKNQDNQLIKGSLTILSHIQKYFIFKNAKDMINAPDSGPRQTDIQGPQQSDMQDIY
jgi:hypothetical protein